MTVAVQHSGNDATLRSFQRARVLALLFQQLSKLRQRRERELTTFTILRDTWL